MSSEGYLEWLKRQKDLLESYLKQQKLWEAQDVAETSLLSILRTWDFF